MKCLVTGGAGFIGSHLVEKLVLNGDDVIVIDDLSSGKISNLAAVIDRIDFHVMDVATPLIEPLLENVDVVFHLAARADIVPSIVQPTEYMLANVVGTLRVMEASRKHSVGKVIYAASSSCYGLAQQIPTSEEASINPMYPYALSKWMGEEMVFHWTQLYKMNCLSLRLFNVYGPRARTSGNYGAVLGVFFAQKLAGAPLTIVGDGTQARDFIYVSDVVEAFILASKSIGSGIAINIGANDPRSVNDVAGFIGGDTVSIPHRPGEPAITHADTKLAHEILNWSPRIDFETGMKITMANMEVWHDAPIWSVKAIALATEDWFKYLSGTEPAN